MKNYKLHPHNYSIYKGILAGIVMAVILLLIQLSGNDYAPTVKLLSYFALGGIIIYSLYRLVGNKKTSVFTQGILAGLKMSLIAAITLCVLNILVFLMAPDYTFSKYNLIPSTINQVLVICGILFVETFVIGNLISFISMQYFKNYSRS